MIILRSTDYKGTTVYLMLLHAIGTPADDAVDIEGVHVHVALTVEPCGLEGTARRSEQGVNLRLCVSDGNRHSMFRRPPTLTVRRHLSVPLLTQSNTDGGAMT